MIEDGEWWIFLRWMFETRIRETVGGPPMGRNLLAVWTIEPRGGACCFFGKDPLAMRDAMGDAMGETERRRGCRGRRGPITSKKNVDVVFRA